MQPWGDRVWLNPPYKGIEPWLSRMAVHRHGTVLIFARTETAAWHDHIWPVAAILFFRGRLTFCDRSGKPAAAAPAPSVLIAYGPADAARLRGCGLPGHFVDLTP